MSTNVSPFLCTYFTINPFSPNFSLPVFLCLFLLLNLLIYTSLLSLLSFFLMLLRKGYFINETSSDFVWFWKKFNIKIIGCKVWVVFVIFRIILMRGEDIKTVYI